MPAADEPVFHLMRRALQEHAARWQAELPELTKPQYALLVALADEPSGEGLDQGTAGERAAIDKATLAAMLRRLEERGLISRTVGADRRRRIVRLTSAGAQTCARARPVADAIDRLMLDRLGEADVERLRELLAKLSDDRTALGGPGPR